MKLSTRPSLLSALGLALASQLVASAQDDAAQPPRLDVVFMIDTTSSMSDEIQVVKDKVREMVAKIASGKPTPQARFGLVLYRDRGDEYVTKVIQLTADIDALVATIRDITADGGGDYPESLVEALHVAVSTMNWDTDESVDKTLFIICDAPPHLDYADDFDYKQEIAKALELGITIHAIGCSGLETADAEFLEKEIARAAEGTYHALTYKHTYADAEGHETTMLVAGGLAYALKAEGVPGQPVADWRAGADRLAAAGAVTTAAPASALALQMAENNLDSILLRVVQRQAERKGVKYTDTGHLDILARLEGTDAAPDLTGNRVIRDAAEWQAFWKALYATLTPAPDTPTVDFGKCMALAVLAGEKLTGGYQAHIEAVVEDENGALQVQWWLQEPPADAMVTQALTYPYSIVIVPRRDGEVTWVSVEPPQ